MLIEILLLSFLGIILGVVTGLIPGLHTNLIASFLIFHITLLKTNFEIIPLIAFIIFLTFTNLLIEIIPSIYLGAPEQDSILAVLPGHEMLLQGKGHQAVFLSIVGSIMGLIVSIVSATILFLFLETSYPFFEKMMAWLLIWISIFIILDNKEKLIACIIFLLSGFLGFASLNLQINQPLLPLLTGLFGLSTILNSINNKTDIPKQKIQIEKVNLKELKKPFLSSFLISPICSFLPGLGSSQATIISSRVNKSISREQFLILNSSINTIVMILSFVTLYIIGKSRTGSASAISQIIQLDVNYLFYIVIMIFLSLFISYFLTITISKKISNHLEKINYKILSISVAIFLVIIIFLISNFLGIIVLFSSTFLGLTCQEYGIRKSILMGCLMIPTIIYYLPF